MLLVRSKPLSYALREGSFRLQLRVELLNGAGLLGLLNAPRQDGFKRKLTIRSKEWYHSFSSFHSIMPELKITF
jgi:hypothetical protein